MKSFAPVLPNNLRALSYWILNPATVFMELICSVKNQTQKTSGNGLVSSSDLEVDKILFAFLV